MITVQVFTQEAESAMSRLMQSLTPERTDPVVGMVALRTETKLIEKTPKRTGQTRRHWTHNRINSGTWTVTNTSKVMLFLEKGTRAHGPTSSKFLYIPLRNSAMVWHSGLVRGRDFILTKRVRGIRAMNIVANHRRVASNDLRAAMVNHLRRAVASV